MAIQECYSCLSLVLTIHLCGSQLIFLYISYLKNTQK